MHDPLFHLPDIRYLLLCVTCVLLHDCVLHAACDSYVLSQRFLRKNPLLWFVWICHTTFSLSVYRTRSWQQIHGSSKQWSLHSWGRPGRPFYKWPEAAGMCIDGVIIYPSASWMRDRLKSKSGSAFTVLSNWPCFSGTLIFVRLLFQSVKGDPGICGAAFSDTEYPSHHQTDSMKALKGSKYSEQFFRYPCLLCICVWFCLPWHVARCVCNCVSHWFPIHTWIESEYVTSTMRSRNSVAWWCCTWPSIDHWRNSPSCRMLWLSSRNLRVGFEVWGLHGRQTGLVVGLAEIQLP